jgi:hypothetical protein
VIPGDCTRPIFFCRYPTDVCRVDKDCPRVVDHLYGERCAPAADGQGTRCIEAEPPQA